MSLRINHNIAALDGHRNMVKNDMAISSSLEKLSSGLRINHAADDAAGLVISEQMRAQITGLNQAVSNSEQAVSMVQTSEGALDEMNSLLNKMRQLALHSANAGVNDTNQLVADQKELDNAVASVTRISQNTQFGTKKLLDGSLAGANSYDTTKVLKFDVGSALLARADYTGGLTSLIIDTSAETNTRLVTSGTVAIGFSIASGGAAALTTASFFSDATSTLRNEASVNLNVRVGDTSFTFNGASLFSVTDMVSIINAGQSLYSAAVVTAASGGLELNFKQDSGAVGAANDLAITFSNSSGTATAGANVITGGNIATTIRFDGTSTIALTSINLGQGSATQSNTVFTDQAGASLAVNTYQGTFGVGTNKLANGASLTLTISGKDYTFSSNETVNDILSNVNNAQSDYTVEASRDNGLVAVRNNLGSGGAASDLSFRVTAANGSSAASATLSTVAATFDAGSAQTGAQNAVLKGIDYGVNVTAHLTGAGLPGGRLNLVSSGADASILTNISNGIVIDISKSMAKTASNATAVMTKGALFQIGANSGQQVGIDIKNVAATSLGLGGDKSGVLANLQSLTTKQALVNGSFKPALSVIDKAIDDVTNLRGQLGAFQANTLQSGLNNLQVSHENLTAAESTIRDVDFAAESANFTKNNILVQASTAMLAQANQLPQGVLKLLG